MREVLEKIYELATDTSYSHAARMELIAKEVAQALFSLNEASRPAKVAKKPESVDGQKAGDSVQGTNPSVPGKVVI